VTVRPSSASRGSHGASGRGRFAGLVKFFQRLAKFLQGNNKKVLIGAGLLLLLVAVAPLIYTYVRFSRVIDARLSGDVFNNASLVFSASHAGVRG
jgi:hypothetical protein